MTSCVGRRVFAEDLCVGDVYELGPYVITAEEILRFATEWDPQPHHLDVDGATGSDFGEIIASGVHTIAIFQRLAVAGAYSRWDVLAGRRLRDVELIRPVRPGMALSGALSVESIDMARRDRGLVMVAGVLRDASGATVLTLKVDLYLRRSEVSAG